MRTGILIPPSYISASEQIRFISNGAQSTAPRLLHAFPNQTERGATQQRMEPEG
jgi:hypothetical protein